MLEKMKEQLARYLYDSKMIDLPDPKFKHANVNSGNMKHYSDSFIVKIH